MLQIITDAEVFACMVAAVVFVVRYMCTRWYRTEAGRHMMAFMGVITVLLGMAVLKRLTNISETFWDQIKFVCFSASLGVLIHRDVLLFRYQHVEKKARDEDVS